MDESVRERERERQNRMILSTYNEKLYELYILVFEVSYVIHQHDVNFERVN